MCVTLLVRFFFFSSRRRHTRSIGDWSSDVCSSDLFAAAHHRQQVGDVGRLLHVVRRHEWRPGRDRGSAENDGVPGLAMAQPAPARHFRGHPHQGSISRIAAGPDRSRQPAALRSARSDSGASRGAVPIGGGNHRPGLRRTHGSPRPAAGPHCGVQTKTSRPGPQGDLARVRDRLADAYCTTGIERMKLSIIGLGKLGAPMAAVMAHKGHMVVGVDVNADYVAAIQNGHAPVRETGLEEMFQANRERLSATMDYEQAVLATDATFIIVPTPSDPADDTFSLCNVMIAAEKIGAALRKKQDRHLVVLSSTVMPGATGGKLLPALEAHSGKKCGEGDRKST